MGNTQEIQLKRLLPVLDYVHEHYNQTIDPKALERVSFYSHRSLQRIFKALFQENIGAYQKRLRLENAAKMMHYSDKSITEIALEVGYADLQAFRKAFKNTYGVSPSTQRLVLQDSLQHLKEQLSSFDIDGTNLSPKIVELPEIKVVYKTYHGAYDNAAIDQLWNDWTASYSSLDEIETYGLIYDDPMITAENLCRYDACLALDTIASRTAAAAKVIGGGKYVCFEHRGDDKSIEHTYDAIFGGWLLQNPYNFSSAPIIEHYCEEAESFTLIYVPLA